MGATELRCPPSWAALGALCLTDHGHVQSARAELSRRRTVRRDRIAVEYVAGRRWLGRRASPSHRTKAHGIIRLFIVQPLFATRPRPRGSDYSDIERRRR